MRTVEKAVSQKRAEQGGQDPRRHSDAAHRDRDKILVTVPAREKKKARYVFTFFGRHGDLHKIRFGFFGATNKARHPGIRWSGFEVVIRKNNLFLHPMGFGNEGLHETRRIQFQIEGVHEGKDFSKNLDSLGVRKKAAAPFFSAANGCD